mmetsp:Transcript_3905/g.11913  ORF Transcript_3905/g.11913 Transcript_3905/m.11913 type:complete len:347 (+) Transcript_3905:4316-5356(+)
MASNRFSGPISMRAFASSIIFLFCRRDMPANSFAAMSSNPNCSTSAASSKCSRSSTGGSSSRGALLRRPTVSAATAAPGCGRWLGSSNASGPKSLDRLAQPSKGWSGPWVPSGEPSGYRSIFASLRKPRLRLSKLVDGSEGCATLCNNSLPLSAMLTHPEDGPRPDAFVKCRRSPTSSTSSTMTPAGSLSSTFCDVVRCPFRTTRLSSVTTIHWAPVPTCGSLLGVSWPTLASRTTGGCVGAVSAAFLLMETTFSSRSSPLANFTLTHPDCGPSLETRRKRSSSPTDSSSETMAPLGRRSGSSWENVSLPTRTAAPPSAQTFHRWLDSAIGARGHPRGGGGVCLRP